MGEVKVSLEFSIGQCKYSILLTLIILLNFYLQNIIYLLNLIHIN